MANCLAETVCINDSGKFGFSSNYDIFYSLPSAKLKYIKAVNCHPAYLTYMQRTS